MEMAYPPDCPPRVQPVSMEPLLFRNGNWSTSNLYRTGWVSCVSMEPLLFRNGNACFTGFSRICNRQFQWSHFFSEMEMQPYLAVPEFFDHIVSMEPLLFRNGNGYQDQEHYRNSCRFQWSHFFSEMEMRKESSVNERTCKIRFVSMEPLLFRNGNTISILLM